MGAEPVIKKPKDLRKGDIIRIRVPFEENTSDYYNGYHPKEIRGGEWYKDRFGDTSKPRFCIVIGREDNNVLYLPMTSRHARCDNKHQYTLQDNSMTWKKNEDMKSYVELDTLRAVHTGEDWNIQSFGRVAENDMTNIMVRLGRRKLDMNSDRDQRIYVSPNKETAFEKQMAENGYIVSESTERGKTYNKEDGRTVTKSKWGFVMYHVPMSKEDVTAMVAKREGKLIDDFAKAVADITEKSARQESEVIQ